MRQRLSLTRHAVEEPTINLTPLIDVVFVILIMFILIAPLVEMEQIELADAGPTSLPAPISQQENVLTLQVLGDNSLRFQNIPIRLDQLSLLLQRAKQQQPNGRLRLIHDRKAHFGTYQSVKNAAEAAGFEEMDLLLQPS